MIHLFVDTHAHIYDGKFDSDRGHVLRRADAAGVGAVIAVSETLEDARLNLSIHREFPVVKPAAGLFPTNLDVIEAGRLIALIREERERFVAIGEVGLDFWKVQDNEGQDVQREIFRMFIELAVELDLPLNVHSCSAGRHAIAMLLEAGARKVQLHAFDGKFGTAGPALEAGYYFSVPPSIVRSQQKQKLIRNLPMESLLLESDCPVLGPSPGERNEPANIVLAAKALAEIKGLSLEEVAEITTHNAIRLYGDEILSS